MEAMSHSDYFTTISQILPTLMIAIAAEGMLAFLRFQRKPAQASESVTRNLLAGIAAVLAVSVAFMVGETSALAALLFPLQEGALVVLEFATGTCAFLLILTAGLTLPLGFVSRSVEAEIRSTGGHDKAPQPGASDA